MSGKMVALIILIGTALFGAGLYYTQVYAYYERLDPATVEIKVHNLATGEAEALALSDLEAIDGSSSPIRFRACFTSEMSDVALSETYEPYLEATPLVAPAWFGCFDAAAIGAALEDGRALAFLGEKNIHDGVDRVIAVMPDGAGYAWHQLNEKYQEDGDEFID